MKNLILLLLVSISLTSVSSAQWYQQVSGTSENLQQIQFINPAAGWVQNNINKIFRTTNGGAQWSLLYQAPVLISGNFINENTGWFISRPWGLIFKTTDSGNNWTQICSLYCTEFSHLNFINSTTGFAIAGVCLDGGKLFKSTDGGVSWNMLQVSSSLQFFSCLNILDEQNLLAASSVSPDSAIKIFSTTDGGITWSQRSTNIPGTVYEMQFFTQQTGWCRINSTIYKTTNGGISWISQVNSASAFCFVDVNNGWYSSGGNIFRTTNGGLTWTQQTYGLTNTINDLFFLDLNRGWAAGENGTILYTPNGGLPVELTSFSAESDLNSIRLSWTTASEVNNKGFEIERKLFNDEWKQIAFVAGNGTTTSVNHYSYTDTDLGNGKYFYRLKQTDFDGSFEYSSVVEAEINSPAVFTLEQNFPNPFNPSTVIRFKIPSESFVTLKVFDVLGNEVSILTDGIKTAGTYEEFFQTDNLTAGIYFYTLTAGSFSETKKMLVLK